MSPGRESPTIPSRYLPTDTIFGTVVDIVRKLSSVTWESAAKIQRSSSCIPTSVVIIGPFPQRKKFTTSRRVLVGDTPFLSTI